MKKKHKIGLVLGGGGGKGAYQAGVLKALQEYKIDKYITHISGTSIGAINAVAFLSGGADKCVDVWENIDNSIALTKKSLKDIIVGKSLFSRDGFIDVAKREIDFDKVSNSKINTFVIASPIGRKNANAQDKFKLNGLKKDEIINILLATSAIPYIYEPVYINGIRYKDGYAVDNVPIKALKDEGCDTIFVVPLREYSPGPVHANNYTTIIDFVSGYNDYGFLDGTLDFDKDRAKMRIEHGYEVGKQLIEKLIREGVIAIKWRHKIRQKWINYKNKKNYKEINYYYSLKKSEITHRPRESEEDITMNEGIPKLKVEGNKKKFFHGGSKKNDKENQPEKSVNKRI